MSWSRIFRSCIAPAAVIACDGTAVTLGESPPAEAAPAAGLDGTAGAGGATEMTPVEPALTVGNVRPVAGLNSDAKDDNITLTADLLEACLTSDRAGGTGDVDVWCATRDAIDSPFNAPVEVAAVNSPSFESSSAISLDGRSLWFGSDRVGGQGDLDIWRADRPDRQSPWSDPVLETALNSTADDIPRQPGGTSATVMPLGSRRTDGTYWTYLAERSAMTGDFSTPDLIVELAHPGELVVDGFLSQDGLTLLYTASGSTSGDPSDLYFSTRDTGADPFGEPLPIEGVNSDFDDRDPWLGPSGKLLYFVSDRDGDFDVYVADVLGG